MKLTRRQEDFIRKLLDLYQEAQEPLHYSALAERLGVNRFTAYDMLRLLEEKGLAEARYRLNAARGGPGRSEIVFLPTDRAHRLIAELTRGLPPQDWDGLKESALDTLRRAETPELDWARELLARLPGESHDPLRYPLEVMAVIALRLKAGAGRQLLLAYLPMLLPEPDTQRTEDLTLLGGFGLGVLTYENADDPAWCLEMFEHVKRYQALIQDMDAEQRDRLAAYLGELYTELKESA